MLLCDLDRGRCIIIEIESANFVLRVSKQNFIINGERMTKFKKIYFCCNLNYVLS
jgi:hypothetical protein